MKVLLKSKFLKDAVSARRCLPRDFSYFSRNSKRPETFRLSPKLIPEHVQKSAKIPDDLSQSKKFVSETANPCQIFLIH